MRKNRFLTRFALGALVVVVVAAGAALVAGGVATAAPTQTPTPTPTPPTGPRATSTTLTTSPASPVDEGTAVTLNAKITVFPGLLPIRVGEPAGTVQFKDGDTDIGAPVDVTPNTAVPDPPTGTASMTTSTLVVGSHQLTAVFTPREPQALQPSTSPAVTFLVNATGVRDTRTTLRVFPVGPFPAGTPRLLLARVAPGAAAGTVQFKDGNTALEAPVPVVDGFAFIITRQLTTVGTHPLTAMFTPTNPAAFKPSTSNTVRVEVEGGDDNGDG